MISSLAVPLVLSLYSILKCNSVSGARLYYFFCALVVLDVIVKTLVLQMLLECVGMLSTCCAI